MNLVKGFRFHPTDEELIEYLRIKTFGHDSLVQVIAEIQDICEFEPWELPGRSTLQTGDRLWYFMYPPKYKYRNSKLISRTTLEGYWKPTGKARKIISSETRSEIGSKKTLVFYKGQCNNNNKNKTSWVMHEYELNATTESDQDILDPNGSSEPEASNNPDSVHNRCSAVEICDGERSNQYNMTNEDEGSNVSSKFINHVAEDTIMTVPLHLKEISTDQNGPKYDNRVQDPYGTDDESCNSILTNYDEIVTNERSNQHNIVGSAEGFEWLSNLEYSAKEDIIPTEPLYNVRLYNILSHDVLLAAPEATNNSNCIRNQYTINKEHGEFLNSTFADKNEGYLQEGNMQQCLEADNEGFGLPCIGSMTELSNSMEKSRKRPRQI